MFCDDYVLQVLQGTNPTIYFDLPDDVDAQDIDAARITVESVADTITHTMDDGVFIEPETNSVGYEFTEEETLKLVDSKKAKVQVLFSIASTGKIVGTVMEKVRVERSLSKTGLREEESVDGD